MVYCNHKSDFDHLYDDDFHNDITFKIS